MKGFAFAFVAGCDDVDTWLDSSAFDNTCWAIVSLDEGSLIGELVSWDGVELCTVAVSEVSDAFAATVVPTWAANSPSRRATASLIVAFLSRF